MQEGEINGINFAVASCFYFQLLAWSFGVGGSVAVAHASLRNHTLHKNDDEEKSMDDEVTANFDKEAGRIGDPTTSPADPVDEEQRLFFAPEAHVESLQPTKKDDDEE